MKKFAFILVLSCFFFTANAQSYSGAGDSKLNAGFEIYGYGSGIKATYDYGINELFSVGAGASFFLSNDKDDYFIYARTGVHLGEVLDLPYQLDIYPGVDLGYLSSGNIGINGYIAARYFVTKNIGIFAEIGNSGAVGLSLCL